MNRAGRGRPLRFVAGVLVGWIGLRVAMLLPGAADLASAVEQVPVQRRPRAEPVAAAVPQPVAPRGPVRRVAQPVALRAPSLRAEMKAPPLAEAIPILPISWKEGPLAAGRLVDPLPQAEPAALRSEPAGIGDLWQASLWLVARPGRGIGAAPGGGQIGGSQYGLRIARSFHSTPRLAVTARLAGPLAGSGIEAALGLEWRTASPVRVLVERRIGLDGAPGGSGVGVILGIDRAFGRLRVEAYGQAGAVLRERADGYADGAARLTRRLSDAQGTQVSIGMGGWGAAQRDAQRLDVGPSLLLSVPLGGSRARIALDWRQRIAGNIRPGSGLALSIGSDF
ncbi:hypothetical protein ACNFJ7_13870 [Sphingomonas sp. HT-1]|uniref:hypothetical protein n=1 Tax=unclassified Sphingomonas TaxID=196159 RepID=UPI0002DB73F3|nr:MULTISPECIES: hypothetical protein [unclassified Sphingomonas]KTF68005.1 hypothetical protein ATB93_15605 [Sphingomonas sp. WG]